MSEGESVEQSKAIRPRKTRENPVVQEGPAKSAERQAFGRVARKRLEVEHEPIAKARVAQREARNQEALQQRQERETVQSAIAQIDAALSENPVELVRRALEERLAGCRAELEALERQIPTPEDAEHIKVDREKHPELYRDIEQELRRLITDTRSIEGFLEAAGRKYGGWTPKAEGLGGLATFVETEYLPAGAVERAVLEQYLAHPGTLAEAARERIVRVLRQKALAEAEAQIPASIVDRGLRDQMQQRILPSLNTPEQQAKRITEYLASPAGEFVDMQQPYAARAAVREAMLAKGVLQPHEMRFLIGTYLAQPRNASFTRTGADFSRLSNEDRASLLRYRKAYYSHLDGERQQKLDADRPTLERLGLGYSPDGQDWLASAEAVTQMEQEEQWLNTLAEAEKAVEGLAAKNWDEVVAKEYARSGETYLGRNRVAAETMQQNASHAVEDITIVCNPIDDAKAKVSLLVDTPVEQRSPEDVSLALYQLREMWKNAVERAKNYTTSTKDAMEQGRRAVQYLATDGAKQEVEWMVRDVANNIAVQRGSLHRLEQHMLRANFIDYERARATIAALYERYTQDVQKTRERVGKLQEEQKFAVAAVYRPRGEAVWAEAEAEAKKVSATLQQVEGQIAHELARVRDAIDQLEQRYQTELVAQREQSRATAEELAGARVALQDAKDAFWPMGKKQKIDAAQKQVDAAEKKLHDAEEAGKRTLRLLEKLKPLRGRTFLDRG